jgi:arabinofuranosyltransferase
VTDATAPRPRRRLASLGLATWLAAFLALALVSYRTFVPDDLFIYLRFAANLASGHGASFNPGQATYGFTSALWLGLLTLPAWAGADPLAAARALSAGAALLALAAMATLAGRLAGDRRAAWAASLLLGLDAWFLRWSLSGMETALAVALLLLGFARRLREEREGHGTAGSTALFALLALCRPEALLLLGLAIADDLLPRPGEPWRPAGPRWRRAAIAAAVAAGVAGSWLLAAALRLGTPLPNTAPAKGEPGAALAAAVQSLWRSAELGGATTAIPGLLLLGAAAWGWARLGDPAARRDEVRRHRLAAAWLVALPLLYALSGVTAYSRYLLIWTPLLLASGVAAWTRAATARRLPAALWAAPLLLAAAQNAWLTAAEVAPGSAAYARSLRRVNVAIGRWLAASTPPGTVVAAENIGAIGYVSGRTILDMNGLVTPAVIPYKREGRVDRYLEAHPPDYIIKIDPRPDPWREEGPPRREGPRLRLEAVRILEYDHMFLDQAAPLYYTVYRVLGTADAGKGEAPHGPAGGAAGEAGPR